LRFADAHPAAPATFELRRIAFCGEDRNLEVKAIPFLLFAAEILDGGDRILKNDVAQLPHVIESEVRVSEVKGSRVDANQEAPELGVAEPFILHVNPIIAGCGLARRSLTQVLGARLALIRPDHIKEFTCLEISLSERVRSQSECGIVKHASTSVVLNRATLLAWPCP
jgi:hypothetical protein